MSRLRPTCRLFAGLAFAAFCLGQAVPGIVGNSAEEPVRLVSVDAAGKRQLVTTPIQALRVGMRVVVGRNPRGDDAQRNLPPPDPETWRVVRAQIAMRPGKVCAVELLRPPQWLADRRVEVGARVWLELPEMSMAGEAQILALLPCPPIAGGTHPLITGTFQHLADAVVDVHSEGSAPIGCTAEHPFWSVDREAFVSASKLNIGERVLTAHGNSARITSIVPRAGPQTVYGLEVYGEHVYHVGDAGLLVHNASEYVAAGGGVIRGSNPSRLVFDRTEVCAVRNLSHVDDSTLRAMAKNGIAPKDINGKKLILHHLDQNPAGPVVEMPGFRHSIGNRVQHPLGNAPGIGLSAEQRATFNAWRESYWKARALEELGRRGLTP